MDDPSSDPTRERILDVAEELVREAPADFTVDRVAAGAGVSRATVYRRFERAEELFEALQTERGVAAPGSRVDVRSRVLSAAHEEFGSAGVGGATIQAIAAKAGVSPMTIYNHFEDKEGLVTALLLERGPSSLLPESLGEDEDPLRALGDFVEAALTLAQTQRDLFRLLIAPDPTTRRAFNRVRSASGGVQQKLLRIFERMDLPDGLEPRIAVASLMGIIMANGVVLPVISGSELGTPAELAPQFTRVFLKGILGK